MFVLFVASALYGTLPSHLSRVPGGARFFEGARVDKVLTKNGGVVGVRMENGHVIEVRCGLAAMESATAHRSRPIRAANIHFSPRHNTFRVIQRYLKGYLQEKTVSITVFFNI